MYFALDLKHSIVGGVIGMIVALLYSFNIAHVADLRFKPQTTAFFRNNVEPFVDAFMPRAQFHHHRNRVAVRYQITPEQYRALRAAQGDIYAASDMLPGEQQPNNPEELDHENSHERMEEMAAQQQPDRNALGLLFPS